MNSKEQRVELAARAIERAWMDRSDSRSLAVIAASVLQTFAGQPEINYEAAALEKDRQLDSIESAFSLDALTVTTIRRNLSAREIVDAAVR